MSEERDAPRGEGWAVGDLMSSFDKMLAKQKTENA